MTFPKVTCLLQLNREWLQQLFRSRRKQNQPNPKESALVVFHARCLMKPRSLNFVRV